MGETTVKITLTLIAVLAVMQPCSYVEYCEFAGLTGMKDHGFRDGGAVGYNTTCQIRFSVTCDHKHPSYLQGYNRGYDYGARLCHIDGGPDAWDDGTPSRCPSTYQ